MILRRLAWTGAALAVVACTAQGPAPAPEQIRLSHLERGLRLARDRPAEAAAELAAAGPGAGLEHVRLDTWLGCLEAFPAPASAWQALLDAGPPHDLRSRVLLGLGRVLAEAGDPRAAEVLDRAAVAGSIDADVELLDGADPDMAWRAARRLALTHPGILHREAPELERGVLRDLDPGSWLVRAAAWERTGRPAAAVRELARRRFRGADERARRAQLALAEGAVRSPEHGLRVLGTPAAGDGAGWLARTRLLRQRAWDRSPAAATPRLFRAALAAAQRARRAGADREAALTLVLETATEGGALDEAWEAWRELEASGWRSARRGWLGRRLGVALAWRGDRDDRVRAIASALPDDRRCLSYWGSRGDVERQRALAAAPVPDLYATWARADLGLPEKTTLHLPAPVAPGEAPPTVRDLLAVGATRAAREEWRRLRGVRGAAPAEALAAATLEAGAGRTSSAIRWLLAGFPELGGVELDRAPADAVQAYLPLAFVSELRSAAREFDLPPYLLAGLARQESAFVPGARSAAGAVGLLQLIPGTAGRHAAALGLDRRPDLTEPATNLRLGARELAALLERFGAMEPALAAYNAGEARVARWWKAEPDPRRFTEEIPIPETYTYVRRVVYLAEAYRLVYGPDLGAGGAR